MTDTGQRGPDPLVARHPSVLDRDVQILADHDASTLQIEVDRVTELERLVYSMKSTLTAKQMARLLQGELKMNAVIDLALAVAIPIDG